MVINKDTFWKGKLYKATRYTDKLLGKLKSTEKRLKELEENYEKVVYDNHILQSKLPF